MKMVLSTKWNLGCMLMVIFSAISVTPSFCLIRFGPQNVTRTAGETNVLISCPNYGDSIPVWEINGTLFDVFHLPKSFLPVYNGIVIQTVVPIFNGTTFRCYYVQGTSSQIEQSSLGILTVTRGSTSDPAEKQGPSFIYIDHQNMYFDEYNSHIAWIPGASCISYLYYSITPNCSNVKSTTFLFSTNKRIFILANSISRNVHLNITCSDGNQVYHSSFSTILIHENVTTLQLFTSLSSSKIVSEIEKSSLSLVYVAIPRNSFSTPFDCHCPILIFPLTDECADLMRCSCINETIFASSIKICDSNLSYVLYLNNLTTEMNGSRLHFFLRHFCLRGDTFQDHRVYTKSLEIVEVLPDPPKVSIDGESFRVTFSNDHGIEVEEYEVSVYDNTGEKVIQMSFPSSNSSFELSSVMSIQPQCVPYLLSVKAINSFGFSDTNVTEAFNQTEEGSVCECITENVAKVGIIQLDDRINSITVEITCLQMHYVKLDLQIKVESSTNAQSIAISCSKSNKSNTMDQHYVAFDDLQCSRQYNISVQWTAIDNDNVCLIKQISNVQPHCIDTRIIIIGSTLGLLGPIIIIVTMICCILLIRHIRKRCHKGYDTVQGSIKKT